MCSVSTETHKRRQRVLKDEIEALDAWLHQQAQARVPSDEIEGVDAWLQQHAQAARETGVCRS